MDIQRVTSRSAMPIMLAVLAFAIPSGNQNNLSDLEDINEPIVNEAGSRMEDLLKLSRCTTN
jgi:hypothetical protein